MTWAFAHPPTVVLPRPAARMIAIPRTNVEYDCAIVLEIAITAAAAHGIHSGRMPVRAVRFEVPRNSTITTLVARQVGPTRGLPGAVPP